MTISPAPGLLQVAFYVRHRLQCDEIFVQLFVALTFTTSIVDYLYNLGVSTRLLSLARVSLSSTLATRVVAADYVNSSTADLVAGVCV